MAYKSLYRTYRPQTFKDVAGQEAIITTLKHAIDEKKIAHAYLFCGPRGTGKTTVAKLLAKAVNCTGDPKPCGECENCKQIENKTHPPFERRLINLSAIFFISRIGRSHVKTICACFS